MLYSFPVVSHLDQKHLLAGIERHEDADVAIEAEFKSVFDQIDQNLLQS